MSRKKNWRKNKNKYWNQDLYWQSAQYNAQLFNWFGNQIMQLALARFTWINLPSTCDERFLELTLLTQGVATIAKKRGRKHLYSTQAVLNGYPNVYNNPTSWRSFGNNGWSFDVSHSNGVLIYDNLMRYPLAQGIDIWARELADILRTKQVNRLHAKTPFIIKAPQEKEIDATNLFKQAAGGEPAILATKSIDMIDYDVLKTDVEFLGNELIEDFANTWQQIYAMLGINSLPYKAERQIEDEINALDKPAEFMALSPLKCRREACKRLNDRFGDILEAPIDVVWSNDFNSVNYEVMHNIKSFSEVMNNA